MQTMQTNPMAPVTMSTAAPVAVQQPNLTRSQWNAKRSSSKVVSASGKWQTMKDTAGRQYYFCPATGVTQWQRPRELAASESSVSQI